MNKTLPQGWTREPLRQVVDQFIVPMRDKPPKWSGSIPWCRIEDFDGKYLHDSKSGQYVNEDTVDRMNLRVFPVGTVLCSCSARLGVCTITGRELVSNQTFIGLMPGVRVDGEFLYYNLSSQAEALQKLSSGTTIAYLPREKFEAFEIDLPPNPEQKTIRDVLATIDDAIEHTEGLIAKYQQIKAGLMHDLFARGLAPDGSLRPASESQRTTFGWIPRTWHVGSLLDVSDRSRQPILTGPFGADLGNDDFIAEGVPVLRIGNIQQGYLDLSDLLFVTPQKARDLDRYSVCEGDLLFARQGATTGRNALANKAVKGYLINYHIIRVALDQNRCSPVFIEAAFDGEIVKRQIEREKGRGTREGINTAQLKALELPLAPLQEQRVIANLLRSQVSLIVDR